jgi:hypothetical protein
MVDVVCHLPNGQALEMPTATQFPSIPTADPSDPASMGASLHALKHAVELLSGQRAPPKQPGGLGTQKKSPQARERFTEVSRTMKTERVFNPTDHSQFVDVQTVQHLILRDNLSGNLWTWTF